MGHGSREDSRAGKPAEDVVLAAGAKDAQWFRQQCMAIICRTAPFVRVCFYLGHIEPFGFAKVDMGTALPLGSRTVPSAAMMK